MTLTSIALQPCALQILDLKPRFQLRFHTYVHYIFASCFRNPGFEILVLRFPVFSSAFTLTSITLSSSALQILLVSQVLVVLEILLPRSWCPTSTLFVTPRPLSLRHSASYNSPLIQQKTPCREDVMAIASAARQ